MNQRKAPQRAPTTTVTFIDLTPKLEFPSAKWLWKGRVWGSADLTRNAPSAPNSKPADFEFESEFEAVQLTVRGRRQPVYRVLLQLGVPLAHGESVSVSARPRSGTYARCFATGGTFCTQRVARRGLETTAAAPGATRRRSPREAPGPAPVASASASAGEESGRVLDA